MKNLWPREIAQIIADQPTREARSHMLLQVRPEWQDLVRDHLAIRQERLTWRHAEAIAAERSRERRRVMLAEVPDELRDAVKTAAVKIFEVRARERLPRDADEPAAVHE